MPQPHYVPSALPYGSNSAAGTPTTAEHAACVDGMLAVTSPGGVPHGYSPAGARSVSVAYHYAPGAAAPPPHYEYAPGYPHGASPIFSPLGLAIEPPAAGSHHP